MEEISYLEELLIKVNFTLRQLLWRNQKKIVLWCH